MNHIEIEEIYDLPTGIDSIQDIVEKDTYDKIISGLQEREKEVVSLKILSNLTFREIGQILNIPTATAQWRYYKSLHCLKILIGNISMLLFTSIIHITRRSQKNRYDQYWNLKYLCCIFIRYYYFFNYFAKTPTK